MLTMFARSTLKDVVPTNTSTLDSAFLYQRTATISINSQDNVLLAKTLHINLSMENVFLLQSIVDQENIKSI